MRPVYRDHRINPHPGWYLRLWGQGVPQHQHRKKTMTVKSLTPEQKEAIGGSFSRKEFSLPELATLYNRSRRTIVRTLEEQGFTEVVKARKKKPVHVPLPVIPTSTATWFHRFINKVSRLSRRWEL